jgi:hypothetical protein
MLFAWVDIQVFSGLLEFKEQRERSMRHALAVLGAGAMATLSLPASAATYLFSGGGFTDGATFTGSFDASDLDMNGQISSFQGEVSAFAGFFSGNSLVRPLNFDFDDLFGLVYDLDGFIGDGLGGDIEGLAVGSDLGQFFVGPGPGSLCDGTNLCALVDGDLSSDQSVEGLSVTNAIPEPGTWALLLMGFGALGTALRSRRNDSARGLAV